MLQIVVTTKEGLLFLLKFSSPLDDFWVQTGALEDVDGKCPCFKCGVDSIAEVWNCAECGLWFHSTCCSYENGSLCKEVELPDGDVKELDAFCSLVCPERELTRAKVVNSMKEARANSIFLCDP